MTPTRKGIEISGLVDAYYEVGPSKGYEIGQIVWMPAIYPDKNKTIIDINVSQDPTETALPAILSTYDNRKNTFPVKSFLLDSKEVFFVNRGKLRPSIIVASLFTRWPSQPSEQIYLCVPLYTLEKGKIGQDFVVGSQAFHYSSKFYLPPQPNYHIEEAIGRFEYIQAVDVYALKAFQDCGHAVMLTKEFFGLLKIQLARFWGYPIAQKDSEEITAYGELILEEARKQGVKV